MLCYEVAIRFMELWDGWQFDIDIFIYQYAYILYLIWGQPVGKTSFENKTLVNAYYLTFFLYIIFGGNQRLLHVYKLYNSLF